MLYTGMFIGRRYMGKIVSILHKTLSNQLIIVPPTCKVFLLKLRKKFK